MAVVDENQYCGRFGRPGLRFNEAETSPFTFPPLYNGSLRVPSRSPSQLDHCTVSKFAVDNAMNHMSYIHKLLKYVVSYLLYLQSLCSKLYSMFESMHALLYRIDVPFEYKKEDF